MIERICDTQAIIADEAIKAAIGDIVSLPSPPAIYTQLLQIVGDDCGSPERVAHIIKQDSALLAQILHVVNSSYFGLGRPIVNAQDAVTYLGMNMIRQLALAAELFREAPEKPRHVIVSMRDIQQHALLTAGIATSLFSTREDKDTAFVAALLHDMGKLLMATAMPSRTQMIFDEMQSCGDPMAVVERRFFGVTHAEIGAYLLGLWQLPFVVVEAVANHHCPARVTGASTAMNFATATHIADALAHEAGSLSHANEWHAPSQLDMEHLTNIGLAGMVDEWRAMAREVTRSQSHDTIDRSHV